MKKISILTVIVLLAATTVVLWAADEDGAKLFEGKCSMCHGPKGEGNAGMPQVKGLEMTAEKMTEFLLKGNPEKTIHKGPVADLNEEQAKAIVDFIKKLK